MNNDSPTSITPSLNGTVSQSLQRFFSYMQNTFTQNTFIKLTLSKCTLEQSTMRNIYAKPVTIKGKDMISFVYRHTNKDVTQNYTPLEALALLQQLLGQDFLIANLFALTGDVQVEIKPDNKVVYRQTKPVFKELANTAHDRDKKRFIYTLDNVYLKELGITNTKGLVVKGMNDKYKQINKYIEIIDSLLKKHTFADNTFYVADMGAGKGYLTFALYDYLTTQLKLTVDLLGIECRPELVEQGNLIAQKAKFERLHFEAKTIENAYLPQLNMLIALHACDTATDQAIFRGISAGAQYIVVAPCCHHELRSQLRCQAELAPMLQHGIIAERQSEMLTDTLRALVLEASGYRTKVFEFVSTEHTPKNLMITASRYAQPKPAQQQEARQQIATLCEYFGIKSQYLLQLLGWQV